MKLQGKGRSMRNDKYKGYPGIIHEVLKRALCIAPAVSLSVVLISCATPSANLPAPPPKYVYQEPAPGESPAPNSLWAGGTSLFEDTKARRPNDLLTIIIVENLPGSGPPYTEKSLI